MAAKISEEEVRHVAKLSRLRLGDDEVRHFADQLSAVLDYISKLNELDVENVEPMAHAADVTNVLRDDDPKPPLAVEGVLAGAPDASGQFFKVPKVLGEGSGA